MITINKHTAIFTIIIIFFSIACNKDSYDDLGENVSTIKTSPEDEYLHYVGDISKQRINHSAYLNSINGGFIYTEPIFTPFCYNTIDLEGSTTTFCGDSLGGYGGLALYQLNKNDKLEWHHFYEKENIDIHPGEIVICQDSTINIVTTQRDIITEQSSLFLSKLNQSGELVSERECPIDGYIHEPVMAQTADEGFIIAASIVKQDSMKYNSLGKIIFYDNYSYVGNYYQLMKIAKSGEIEWSTINEKPDWKQNVNSLIQTSDNGYLMSVHNYKYNEEVNDNGNYAELVKTDANETISGKIDLPFHWIRQDDMIKANDEGVVFATVQSITDFWQQDRTLSLVKLNDNGQVLWQKDHEFFQEYGFPYETHILYYGDEGYFVVIDNSVILKFDNLGNIIE